VADIVLRSCPSGGLRPPPPFTSLRTISATIRLTALISQQFFMIFAPLATISER
jgi:hypothetical protein